jgi:hypothetical protein
MVEQEASWNVSEAVSVNTCLSTPWVIADWLEAACGLLSRRPQVGADIQ